MDYNNFIMSTIEQKKDIRKKILAIRKELTKEAVTYKSTKIMEQVYKHPYFLNAKEICFYVPIQNEVDVLIGLEYARILNKKIYLPRIIDNKMDFFLYDENTSLKEGAFHILEPDSEIILNPSTDTLVLMPGSVFSIDGNRIGYGGGFYDRYLDRFSFVKKIAVAYDFQIIDALPYELTDVKPNFIIGEEGYYGKFN